MRQELFSGIPRPERNGKLQRVTKGSFEVDDVSPPESSEVDRSVLDSHGRLEPYEL